MPSPSLAGLGLSSLRCGRPSLCRFGLPNIEFVVGFDDTSRVRQRGENGGICPAFAYCKHPK